MKKQQNQYDFKGIIDTTFRDGQQSPLLFDTHKYRFSYEDKKLLIKGLIALGITQFEFFSPVVSKVEADDFRKIKKFAHSITKNKLTFLTHCRCHPTDIKMALDAGFDGLNLYMGLSSHAQEFHYGKDLDQLLEAIKTTIKKTREKYPKLYIRFSAEDAFRTPLKNIFKVYDEIYEYVDTFGMPDTVGVATPQETIAVIKILKNRYPKVALEGHFHNDRGYTLVNACAAVQAGIDYIDASLWGLAERSGISSTTGLLLNLYHCNPGLVKNYNLELCYPLNILLGTILKQQVPYTEPVSLTNRTHTAGVHQKAVIKNSVVYEAHSLEKFGVNHNQILLGPLSGWNLIYYYLKEIKQLEISEMQAQEVTTIFKNKVNSFNHRYRPEHLLDEIISDYKFKSLDEKQQFSTLENLT